MQAQHKEQKPHSSGTEGGRRPTGDPDESSNRPDPEFVARPVRRRLTNAYKLKALTQVDALRAQGNGAIGAYLRKEGLYYSMVHNWSLLREKGLLTVKPAGSVREKSRDAVIAENKQLRRKLEQIEKRLHKTELLVELQKKIAAMMDLESLSGSERRDAA